jgi:hypothetical protein
VYVFFTLDHEHGFAYRGSGQHARQPVEYPTNTVELPFPLTTLKRPALAKVLWFQANDLVQQSALFVDIGIGFENAFFEGWASQLSPAKTHGGYHIVKATPRMALQQQAPALTLGDRKAWVMIWVRGTTGDETGPCGRDSIKARQ